MPEISRFFGIVVFMIYKDHAPPHFHAKYGEYQISVDIQTGAMRGEFPRRAKMLLLEWLELNRGALLENWSIAVKGDGELHPIEGLDQK